SVASGGQWILEQSGAGTGGSLVLIRGPPVAFLFSIVGIYDQLVFCRYPPRLASADPQSASLLHMVASGFWRNPTLANCPRFTGSHFSSAQ
ncbi:hypothetical protein HAX54_034432, partial [Datura stramonium]|nr:hypothetical protein [Datura stramonium]